MKKFGGEGRRAGRMKTDLTMNSQLSSHSQLMSRQPTDARVLRIISVLAKEPRTRLSGLTRHVHLSQSRLEHLFKEQTGRPLTGYILALRLMWAAAMLQESGMHVKEIATRTGYAHVPSFTRAFKRRFGLQPCSYRLKNAARRQK
jgi:AraC family transcriptional regulator, arabinose operon regulatory protein